MEGVWSLKIKLHKVQGNEITALMEAMLVEVNLKISSMSSFNIMHGALQVLDQTEFYQDLYTILSSGVEAMMRVAGIPLSFSFIPWGSSLSRRLNAGKKGLGAIRTECTSLLECFTRRCQQVKMCERLSGTSSVVEEVYGFVWDCIFSAITNV